MSSPYKLTFVIPTLNEEHYLPLLLNDLKKQKNQNFNVIVVDGSSQDKTVEIARKFKEFFPLKIVSTNRRNLSYQRNLGAEAANGEYIVFIDADSRIRSIFTLNLEQSINKYRYLIFLPSVIPDKGNQTDKILFSTINIMTDFSQYVGKPAPSIGCMIFQKDFFHFLGGYNETGKDEKSFFPEDHDIIMRARKYGVIGKCLKNVKIGFSLRRTKKEGRLKVMTQYMRSALYMSFKGTVDKKLFDYEMGGQLFDKKTLQKNTTTQSKNEQLKNLAKQFAASLKEIIKE